jgi:asparagine synthase (glutamine-hydrolysing)
MCGIAGLISLNGSTLIDLPRRLKIMGSLLAHRGPDGAGQWHDPQKHVGLAHRRLAIIDLTPAAAQPMSAASGGTITYNGEIYNYVELRRELAPGWQFHSQSDTECILAAYDRWGDECLGHLRGMFAFALWDGRRRRLFCARDRFGIKPLYYAIIDDRFYFASEIKALVPFLPDVETDVEALGQYFTFQFTLGGATLFKGVHELLPGHRLIIEDGNVKVSRYWDVHYDIDYDHSPQYFERRLKELLDDSVRIHLRSDVPVGSYLSGGIDSSLMAILASRLDQSNDKAFHGKFTQYPGYDESAYARAAADNAQKTLYEVNIGANDFCENIQRVIYHLDYPVAGPGSFPQYMVSKLAAKHVKVVLGGQGGDETFGGYARYLLAYFEQCIRAAIEGSYKNGNFVVTAESIIPNLGVLREYMPLIKMFWQEGLFEAHDRRYFRLIDRSADMTDEVNWELFDKQDVYEAFTKIFNSTRNVRHEAYFDSMTHFDFKTLLPALLHVEDRMSMAHGLESRVPFLDHPLIEFVATAPADVKFKNGHMKHLLRLAYKDAIPREILERRDKMGFPVPLKEWLTGELHDFVWDILHSQVAEGRPYINAQGLRRSLEKTSRFSRKIWGLLSLELWQRGFHDRAAEFRAMTRNEKRVQASGS